MLTVRFEPLHTADVLACLRDQEYASATSTVPRFRYWAIDSAAVVDLGSSDSVLRARVSKALRALPFVQFVARALTNESTGVPVIYTGALYVQFHETDDAITRAAALTTMGLRRIVGAPFADNAFIGYADAAPETVFALADTLIRRTDIRFATPEVFFYNSGPNWLSPEEDDRAPAGTPVTTPILQHMAPASAQEPEASPCVTDQSSAQTRLGHVINAKQWHLRKTEYAPGVVIDASASVAEAHRIATGKGVTIAVMDDGFACDHPEFRSPGKIMYPQRFKLATQGPDVAPETLDEAHGTGVAGVACADGTHAASGVAPAARCMPIVLSGGIGSISEALAFDWARQHGADVIVCSWGPPDGTASDPYASSHYAPAMPMPSYTREAIHRAATLGRRGAGCAIFFAAGNGNELMDLDPYASHPLVFAIGACNEHSERAQYSDFGKRLFCVFPSNDDAPFLLGRSREKPLQTSGIWAPSPTYSEYSPREILGDMQTLVTRAGVSACYTDAFGGTSSAAPGAAGVAALVLEVVPDLPLAELRQLLAQACDRIDEDGAAIATAALDIPVYDEAGHSLYYGYGRINALRAVQMAQQRARLGSTAFGTHPA